MKFFENHFFAVAELNCLDILLFIHTWFTYSFGKFELQSLLLYLKELDKVGNLMLVASLCLLHPNNGRKVFDTRGPKLNGCSLEFLPV